VLLGHTRASWWLSWSCKNTTIRTPEGAGEGSHSSSRGEAAVRTSSVGAVRPSAATITAALLRSSWPLIHLHCRKPGSPPTSASFLSTATRRLGCAACTRTRRPGRCTASRRCNVVGADGGAREHTTTGALETAPALRRCHAILRCTSLHESDGQRKSDAQHKSPHPTRVCSSVLG
jgi:hypothetical protein